MKKKIRNALASLIAHFFILVGLNKKAIKKLLKSEIILSIYFHNPTKSEFSDTVKFLKKHGFKFIGLEELLKIANGLAPFPKGTVLITVDDGWDSNFENMVPVAQEEQVPITIFATTDAIESGNYWFNYVKKGSLIGLKVPSKNSLKKLPNSVRLGHVEKIKETVNLGREAMTISQLQTIDKLQYVSIEAHSNAHPILPNCTDEESYGDIKTCKQKLEKWLERPLTSFAYPNGDFGEREMNYLYELGFKLGFANNPAYIYPANLDKIYSLPRIGFLEGASKAENQCRVLGVWHNQIAKRFR